MRHIKQYSLVLVCSVLCCVVVTACHHKDKSKSAAKTQIIVAKLDTPVQRLYYSGTLLPIETVGVEAPVAGNITDVGFTYGDRVTKGQVLLVLHSRQLAESYRKTVNDFLHKKQTYQTQKESFSGTEALYKAGIVSRNEYQNAKDQFENTALDYLQSQFELQKVLFTANVDPKQIEGLSISQTDVVNKILQRRFRRIEITAPSDGIALFPAKDAGANSGSNSDSSSQKMMNGADVKEGQLLLQIGDLSGLSAKFDVSEIDIDRIHKGMSVIVTGNAFPGAELKGEIVAVSSQANQSSGQSGLSTFSVKVKIPHLETAVAKKIRVGMTAKFEIDIQGESKLMLPVNAVTEKNGASVVTVLDANGKETTVPVVTGSTTPTQVVIISGIKAGDKVVVKE